MKDCPRCAEQVQPAARICRYCDYEFTPEETAVAEVDARVTRVVKAAPGVLALLFLVWMCQGIDEDAKKDRAREVAVAQASIHDPKPCRRLIRKAQRAGVVRAWRRGDEIQVDELLWTDLPADAKRGLMLSLHCDALDGRADDSAIGLFVRAYGWRSGKELAIASRYGVELK